MSVWDDYPKNYRKEEVEAILRALRAGESVLLLGLSGAGKSNLLGFLENRWPLTGEADELQFVLIDCNRLEKLDTPSALKAVRRALGDSSETENEVQALTDVIDSYLASNPKQVCLTFDRFELLQSLGDATLYNNLRLIRDAHKYNLTFLIATRDPLDADNELAELVFANTLWLGPLSKTDADWNVARYAQRHGENWDEKISSSLVDLSGGYPSMLRAVCEAYAALKTLEKDALIYHSGVQRRVGEFWADKPSQEVLEHSRLADHPMLTGYRPMEFDVSGLTAKEHTLLNYFMDHPDMVCEKEDLIQAVWPEDKIYQEGIRDDSLAQLVRRLRKKIEPDSSEPRYIHTAAGRGYKFTH